MRAAAGATAPGRQTYFGTSDMIFPHLATGGGWSTSLVLLNLSNTAVDFGQTFTDTNGQPLTVTIKSVPDGQTETTDSIQGTLQPGATFSFELQDQGVGLQTGWSGISYDSTNARLGGYAIFRASVQGLPDFEALVPMSAFDDYKFLMPYDNLNGFVTSMALVNPASNSASQVFVSILDKDGNTIGQDTINLATETQVSFSIPERWPVTQNQIGSILFESDIDRLSALGFRFNPGHAFATIPIMNWSGMFN